MYNLDEKDLVKLFEERFSNEFDIHKEFTDDSRKNRIDFILQHKKYDLLIGVECKHTYTKRGTEVGKIVQQAIRYSVAKFMGKRIPVFLFPPISKEIFVTPLKTVELNDQISIYVDRHHNDSAYHHTFNGFLGAFNVGEIIPKKDGSIFMFSNEIIYNSYKDPKYAGYFNQHKYHNLLKKINSFELNDHFSRH